MHGKERLRQQDTMKFPAQILFKVILEVQIKSIIDHMGNLIDADILQSSGNSMMDALALKILYQSAPFEPFPEGMVTNYQQLEIVRDWNFTNS